MEEAREAKKVKKRRLWVITASGYKNDVLGMS